MSKEENVEVVVNPVTLIFVLCAALAWTFRKKLTIVGNFKINTKITNNQ